MVQLRLDESTGAAMINHACGSGRMLLAIAERFGINQPFYGVDCNLESTKMASITLFCNGVTSGEIICANSLLASASFKGGYRFMDEPGALLPIARGASQLWERHMDVFANKPMASEIDVHGSPLPQGLQIRFW